MTFNIKTNRKETKIKTIRFPFALIQIIEQEINGKEVSFSSFIIQACEYAIGNLKDTNEKNYNN